MDRELYLPKSWTEDRDRCAAAKIPGQREFATTGDLAKAMVVRALASPLPIAWVTADAAYGQEWRFRRMLEEAGVGYVLAVPKSQHVHAVGRIDFAIAQAPDEAWERYSCGDGAKGPRIYDWAAAKLPAIDARACVTKPGPSSVQRCACGTRCARTISPRYPCSPTRSWPS